MDYNSQSVNTTTRPLQYTSKLMSALNRFAGSFIKEVPHPTHSKPYAQAYRLLINADTLRHQENTDQAIRCYKALLLLDPAQLTIGLESEAWAGLGKCYVRQGQLQLACDALSHAVDSQPFQANYQFEYAKALQQLGDITKAETALKRSVQLAPQHLEARFNLGLLYDTYGDQQNDTRMLENALVHYQAIQKMDASFLPAINNMGSVYVRLERFQEAMVQFDHLVKKSPDFYRGHMGKGICYDRQGDALKALHYYAKAMLLRPNSTNKAYITSRIAELRASLGKKQKSTVAVQTPEAQHATHATRAKMRRIK